MYALAVLLVVAGVFAFYWFNGQWSTGLRIGAVVGGLVAALAVFMFSATGRETREFLSESRFEMRKVDWTTRQDATRLHWVGAVVGVLITLIKGGLHAVVTG